MAERHAKSTARSDLLAILKSARWRRFMPADATAADRADLIAALQREEQEMHAIASMSWYAADGGSRGLSPEQAWKQFKHDRRDQAWWVLMCSYVEAFGEHEGRMRLTRELGNFPGLFPAGPYPRRRTCKAS